VHVAGGISAKAPFGGHWQLLATASSIQYVHALGQTQCMMRLATKSSEIVKAKQFFYSAAILC
jgi:hypothetical protein